LPVMTVDRLRKLFRRGFNGRYVPVEDEIQLLHQVVINRGWDCDHETVIVI